MNLSERKVLLKVYRALQAIPMPKEGKGPIGLAEYSFDMREAIPMMLEALIRLYWGDVSDAQVAAGGLEEWVAKRSAADWKRDTDHAGKESGDE